MLYIEVLLLAIGLSMDSLAVSVTGGAVLKNNCTAGNIIKIASVLGIFQAGMTVIGYTMGLGFEKYICAFDHWIAFILLVCIGGKMVVEAVRDRDHEVVGKKDQPLDHKEMFLLAVATSIDALAVGITFALLDTPIIEAIVIIGCTTFVLSIVGVIVGNFFGTRYKKKAEIIGGIILILIGLKILLEHLGILPF